MKTYSISYHRPELIVKGRIYPKHLRKSTNYGKIYELDKEKLSNCEKLKEAFVYCNDTNYNYDIKDIDKAVMGDPTETALVKVFFKDTNEAEEFISKANRLFEIPFDSTRKMMTVIMKVNGKEVCYMKGAPERVLERCDSVLENGKIKPLTAQKKKQIYNYIESMLLKMILLKKI